MRRFLVAVIFSVLFVTAAFVLVAPKTEAAFNSNNLLADSIFSDSSSMSAGDVNNFLNGLSSSCISPNSGFEARVPNGYSFSTGFTLGDWTSAGQVIATASQVYGINPRVLLATLQKEQGIVTGTASYGCNQANENEYAAAMGYGCPDSGTSHSYTSVSLYRRNGVEHTTTSSTCVSTSDKAGFSQQVIRGAWLLAFGQQRSRGNTGWAVVTGNWNNSDDPGQCYTGPMTQGYRKRCSSDTNTVYYDGYTTIDGASTHMDTGATAALYWYTPHFSGNQNFDNIYSNWWGSPIITTPYLWGYDGQWAYSDSVGGRQFTSVPTVVPGGKIYVRVKALNVGAQTWTQSSLHLGTSKPDDRVSSFYDSSWLSSARPAQMKEASVMSGDTATFEFTMTAPSTPGTYNEYFNVLVEGREWLNDPGLFFTINVNNPLTTPPNSINTSLSSTDPALHRDDYLLSPDAQSALALQRNGNLALYSNFQLIWETGTQGQSTGQLVMQSSDGNLVLRDANNQPVWNSGTVNNPGAQLKLQTDGNMVIYNGGTPLWQTNTVHNPFHTEYVNTTLAPGLGGIARMYPGQSIDTADRRFSLKLQRDGNLVLYSPTRALWSTGTDGLQTAFLAIQPDGNLVLYDRSGRALWASSTDRFGPSRLILQQDGNLVIYDRFNIPRWNTGTAGAS